MAGDKKMLKKTRRQLQAWLLLFLLAMQAPVEVIASDDRAFFWKAKSETATVYLLGSIHFANPSFYPLRNTIMQAFEQSRYLVVELDSSSIEPGAYQKIVSEVGSYDGNETIADHVSIETYKKLEDYMRETGVPLKSIEKQKPGIMVLNLSALEVMKLGLDPDMGIDVYFINRAKNRKKILELETLEQQIGIFLDFPDGELLLKESLYSMDESEELFNQMIAIWKSGDEKQLQKVFFDDAIKEYPVFAGVYESLFYKRNIKMAEAIKGFLKNRDTYFVVVGAGHLVGDRGIVHLLEKSGHKVERL